MRVTMTIIYILLIVIVMMCIAKTSEFFNGLSDRHKYRGVVAWDIIVLFCTLISLVVRLVTM